MTSYHGYLTDVEVTEEAVILTGSGKLGRANITTLVERDVPTAERRQRYAQTGDASFWGRTDALVIPRSDIAGVELKEATVLRNGSVTIQRTEGPPIPVHFRRKQADAMRELVAELSGN